MNYFLRKVSMSIDVCVNKVLKSHFKIESVKVRSNVTTVHANTNFQADKNTFTIDSRKFFFQFAVQSKEKRLKL